MRHCSGVIYHGEWRDGAPTLLPSKLVIINPTGKEPLEIIQGQPFCIKVQCVNENGEVVEGKHYDNTPDTSRKHLRTKVTPDSNI